MKDAFNALSHPIEQRIIARRILCLIFTFWRQNLIASLIQHLRLPLYPNKALVANQHSVFEIIDHRFSR